MSILIFETSTERELDIWIGFLEIEASEIARVDIDLSAITLAIGAEEVSTDSSISGFGPVNWIWFTLDVVDATEPTGLGESLLFDIGLEIVFYPRRSLKTFFSGSCEY